MTEEGTRQLDVTAFVVIIVRNHINMHKLVHGRVATHTELPENQYLWDVPGYPSLGHIFLNQSIINNFELRVPNARQRVFIFTFHLITNLYARTHDI